ncbi:3-phenylpropionate/cinnamic acid dioxygenase subunit beta [Pseudomonas sp. NMI542_15]|uniref:3-phenylpropionate/cinnamic acid dioxygenase subunit beta n=1 Tax=Pseudomonas sp. NMI542_15 TaxID=2903148 RepID=UPI001E540D56|nr:3-phenylpropionate/cinnamic acid dioxygenase subunit beta [Pseudomonas sp. NMI542_15]MCE0777581.1 3-phenylpropionate/cinnamic acid dioxygenase subunit beta [Pseudomonas sp. NMI542_15]
MSTKEFLTEHLDITPEIASFFYYEADLMDERRYNEWLDLLHEDIKYFMPMRRNVKFGQHADKENTKLGSDISWFDEGKWTLTKRVEQILTGVHYAEEPLSRISHLITNVRVLEQSKDENGLRTVKTSCRFMVYLNRVEYEVNTMVGKRYDTLVETEDGWRVLEREIILDQNVLLVKNLTAFF